MARVREADGDLDGALDLVEEAHGMYGAARGAPAPRMRPGSFSACSGRPRWGGRTGSVIEILVLQALTGHARGDVPGALAALERL